MLDLVWLFLTKQREKSDSGSSYSSMEALNLSSSSPISDSINPSSEGRNEPALFPFESVKEMARDGEGDISSMPTSISASMGRLDQSESSPGHLAVSSDYFNRDHRRVSLPAERTPERNLNFLKSKLSTSSSSFLRNKISDSSSSSKSSLEIIDDAHKLSIAKKTQKSGSLDSSDLAVSIECMRRTHSIGPEKFTQNFPGNVSCPQKKPGGRKSPFEMIKSTLHINSSPRRQGSPNEGFTVKGMAGRRGSGSNVKEASNLDSEIRSLSEMKVEGGEGYSELARSVLSLPAKIKPKGEEGVEGSSEYLSYVDSNTNDLSINPLTSSIPTVVIHYVKNTSSLLYEFPSSNHDVPRKRKASNHGKDCKTCDRSRANISVSRTSPSPLTELSQESGPSVQQHNKVKAGLPRVASVDSVETVVQMFESGEANSEVENASQKTSDSNEKSSSGPLSLPLVPSGRTSPGGKTGGGKSSSSGDASTKVFGKSSSSSSGDKKKKTSSWYNPKRIVLSPSYKSRSEDFKRIFKALPSTERLIVEYSCALQKDILIQGRMYVSQSWICFYANIFRWETILMIRCKDIVRMTKEKTARVIPNAIQICARNEKYSFASFGARDKVFVQLDLVRRNALNDLQMNTAEFWSWVHFYYGDDLGLTSDDDDYAPLTPEDKSKFQTYLQTELGQAQDTVEIAKDALEDSSLARPTSTPPMVTNQRMNLNDGEFTDEDGRKDSEDDGSPLSVDYSDCRQNLDIDADRVESASSDDDEEIMDYCASHSHFSIDVLDEAYNMSVDDVFHHCFSDSQIYREFIKAKKTFDVKLGPWSRECDGKGQKVRNISYTLTLDFSIGPKHSPSTEKQTMYKESEPGRFYLVDTECINEGIPYGENFYITNRYCVSRISSKRSRLKITSQINYKKNVWGFIKNFLEKNVTAGIITSFNVLADLLRLESDRQLITMATPPSQLQHSLSRKKYLRRRRVGGACEVAPPTEVHFKNLTNQMTPVKQAGGGHSRTSSISRFKSQNNPKNQISVDSLVWFVCAVLVVLMIFNGLLFYKLWLLESTATSLLKSRLQDHQGMSRSLNRRDDVSFIDKKVNDHSIRAADNDRPKGLRPGRKRAVLAPDIDQWKNVLATSIHLMDHMRSSLVELKNNINDLDDDDDLDINFSASQGDGDGKEGG